MKENEREKVNPALEKSEHSSKRLKEKDAILILENQLCGTITSQALLNWTRYSKPCDPSHRVVRLCSTKVSSTSVTFSGHVYK